MSPSPLRWRALSLIALAQFLVIMDTSIIGVALPEHAALTSASSQADLSWVFNAYVIAFGGLLLLGGKLSDVFGARRLFVAGFAILTGASAARRPRATPPASRSPPAPLQGVGAALIAPAALSLLMHALRRTTRESSTKALALYGAAAPAGGTAGVFLGGVLTEWLDLAVGVLRQRADRPRRARRSAAGCSRPALATGGRIDVAGAVDRHGVVVAARVRRSCVRPTSAGRTRDGSSPVGAGAAPARSVRRHPGDPARPADAARHLAHAEPCGGKRARWRCSARRGCRCGSS